MPCHGGFLSLIPRFALIFTVSSFSWGSLVGGARWQSLGPDGVGSASDIAIDPANSSILYVGGGSGLYKSLDRGATWSLASRGLEGEAAFSIAIDPEVATTLYAITNNGVFKSTDAAASWFPAGCGLPAGPLRNISLDARNPSRLYVSTRMGVYRTTNGGLGWSAVNNGLNDLNIQSVVAAPSQAGTVYAGTATAGVFRSDDAGASWRPVNSGLPDLRLTLLEVSPSDANLVLAASFTGLFRSLNGGNSWQAADTGLEGGSPFSLSFDPTNPSVLYAGAVIDGIFKSVDGGLTWNPINNGVTTGGLADFGVTGIAVDPEDSSRVYAVTLDGGPGVFVSTNAGGSWNPSGQGLDAHRVLDIVFDPTDSRVLYIIVDDRNGVYKSLDRGLTWQRTTTGFRDQFGLFDNLPLSLAIDPRNRNKLLLGSNGDGLFQSGDGAMSWQRINSPLLENRFLTKVVIDPTTSNVVYVASSDGGVVKSLNGGATFSATGTQVTEIVNDIDVDPTMNSRVYALVGTPDGVYRSLNGGGTWSRGAPGLEGARPEQLQIDPSNSAILYLATRANGVFKSVNHGDTWRPVNQGLGELAIRSLTASPGVLFAGTLNRGVYRSRDGGETWSRAAEGLQDEGVVSLAIQPDDPETVYAGTDAHGLFQRLERAAYLYSAGRLGTRPQFDGLAFSNFSIEGAELRLEQVQTLAGPSTRDHSRAVPTAATVELSLPSGRQIARTRAELFPIGSTQSAWLVQSSDVTDVASFFQFGSGDLSQLDGGVAVTEPLTEFLLTRVHEGDRSFRGERATTRISVFNPNLSPSEVRLSYTPLSDPPGPPVRQITRLIPPRALLEGSFSELFGGGTNGGYVRGEVTSGGGVVAFEVVHFPNRQTILGLNASKPTQPGQSYSAQLASQAGIFTDVNLINSSADPRGVLLTAVREDGSIVGQPLVRMLAPGEQSSIDAESLFGAAGGVGSLVVEADSDGVVGDVVFGDSNQLSFAAALPLQTRAFTEAIFSQVANVPGFFTGLAIFYPGSPFQTACAAPANITVEVTRSDGTVTGSATRLLQVGQRLSQLVPELVPQSNGQAGGYIRIRSDQPVIAQMLFGALNNQGIVLLSAVPPAVVQ